VTTALAITGAVALLAGLGIVLWRVTRPPTMQTPAPPSSWGLDPDDSRWEAEATELLHQSLPKLQDAAAKWGQSVTAVLGAFSLAAFLKGPESFTDLPAPWRLVVIGLVLVGGLAAAAAVYTAAVAAQGSPRWVQQLDGWQLKALHKQLGRHTGRLLNLSRALTAGAALVVLGAMAIAWLADSLQAEEPARQSAVVVWRSGQVRCGQLAGGSAPTLQLADGQTEMRLDDVDQILVVNYCAG
jgi:hypothetical protein